MPPKGTGGASYIELFSASGRSRIEGTSTFIDGSPLVAYKAARDSGVKFSDLYFNDIDAAKAQALDARIRGLGGAAVVHNKPANQAIDDIIFALNPSGLHFAFLDPYNLEYLSFDVIEKLARFKHMDMLVHVSVQDLQRNLDRYSSQGGVLDRFAPGWRGRVNPNQSNHAFRAALMDYWLGEIRKLGTMPALQSSGQTPPGILWLGARCSHLAAPTAMQCAWPEGSMPWACRSIVVSFARAAVGQNGPGRLGWIDTLSRCRRNGSVLAVSL